MVRPPNIKGVKKEVIKVFFINFAEGALIRLDKSNSEEFGVSKLKLI